MNVFIYTHRAKKVAWYQEYESNIAREGVELSAIIKKQFAEQINQTNWPKAANHYGVYHGQTYKWYGLHVIPQSEHWTDPTKTT